VQGRLLSNLFTLMYVNKMNGSRDYKGTKIIKATPKELMKKNRKIVEVIHLKIKKKSKKKKKEITKKVNRKRKLKKLEV
jgi:hypothetical protein